ncbi:hypothetical protein Nham_1964 [Nitrobacter hamburgensis X14]|uniref:Uncharacterized protein n=1 Tax=Nitrobacter hamburgensis (strain DSM 10229 / NCIMB 13809 / X14) TaxID=323097 RepID=Q1QLY1_NITHX|nr:hypothetical protein Nham_1964 [Nitrobacter hamburgensis X14]
MLNRRARCLHGVELSVVSRTVIRVPEGFAVRDAGAILRYAAAGPQKRGVRVISTSLRAAASGEANGQDSTNLTIWPRMTS